MAKRRHGKAKPAPADSYRAIRLWLWLAAAGLFLAFVGGGATRLAESNAAIAEWTPVAGALFSLPVLWFLARRETAGAVRARLAVLLALVFLQALIGWWIAPPVPLPPVPLPRVEAAQGPLALQLVLAALAFASAIWTAIGLTPKHRDPLGPDARSFRFEAGALLVLVLAQIGLGGLVAGLHAGYTYNSWPLMDGHFIPPPANLFFQKPWAANFFDNIALVQLQHRLTAYLALALALFHAFHIDREKVARRAALRARVLAGLVAIEAVLGVATLLLVAPFPVALAHDSFAMIALAMATVHRRKLG